MAIQDPKDHDLRHEARRDGDAREYLLGHPDRSMGVSVDQFAAAKIQQLESELSELRAASGARTEIEAKSRDVMRARDGTLERGAEFLLAQGLAVADLQIVHELHGDPNEPRLIARSYVRVREGAASYDGPRFTWGDVAEAIGDGELDMDDRAMLLRTLDAVDRSEPEAASRATLPRGGGESPAAPAESEPQQECTGATAFWCPRCGDCKCPRDVDGECEFDTEACPLHGPASLHAAAERPQHGQLVRELLANPARAVYVAGEGWVSAQRVCELADGVRRGDPYPWASVDDHGDLTGAAERPQDAPRSAEGTPTELPRGYDGLVDDNEALSRELAEAHSAIAKMRDALLHARPIIERLPVLVQRYSPSDVDALAKAGEAIINRALEATHARDENRCPHCDLLCPRCHPREDAPRSEPAAGGDTYLADSLPEELRRHARALTSGVHPNAVAIALETMANDMRIGEPAAGEHGEVERLKDALRDIWHITGPGDDDPRVHEIATAALQPIGEPAAGGAAIATDPASVAAEIAAQDRQIAELSLRLAAAEQRQETLLAALGRAAEDLGEHATAWTGLRTLEGGGVGWKVARGWAQHAERSAARVTETVAKVRAGEGVDDGQH